MGGGPLTTMAGFQSAQAQLVQTRADAIRSLLNTGVRGVDTRSVPSTAASRVQKAAWEQEEDRKDREVDDMIRRHKEVLKRIDAEEYTSETNEGSEDAS